MFFSCFDVCALFVCVPLLPSYNVHAVDLSVFINRIPRIECVAWHKFVKFISLANVSFFFIMV